MEKVKAIGTNIYAVQKRTEKQLASGIILAQASREARKEAEVLSVGDEVSEVKIGDTIICDMISGYIYKDTDDGLYLFFDESDIRGVVKNGD